MKSILCYGDSNTFGIDPSYTGLQGQPLRLPREKRWTGLLQRRLGEAYYVIEEGLGGRTTAWDDQTVAGRNGLAMLLPILQTHEPLDLIILMLGTNDTKGVYQASVMEICRGMEALVRVCLDPWTYDVEKVPKLLIVSPIHLGPGIEGSWLRGVFSDDAGEKLCSLAEEYQKIAEKYGCSFFDAASVAIAGQTDSVHLDLASHERLAAALADKIHQILPEE